jgi:ankyrin repeat protein
MKRVRETKEERLVRAKRTELVRACRKSSAAAVEALIRSGADVEQDDGHSTPLTMACLFGHEKIVRILLDAGAKKDRAGPDGETPIGYAVSCCHPNAVDALIRAGANVNAVDVYGRFPLIGACGSGSREIVSALLRAGADVSATTPGGESSLEHAHVRGYPEVERVIRDHIRLIGVAIVRCVSSESDPRNPFDLLKGFPLITEWIVRGATGILVGNLP